MAVTMGVRITVQSLWTEATPSPFIYEFAQSRIVIGRSRSADVQLPHTAVSGSHASIREQDAGYVLVDEGSTNGTRVNDIRVAVGRPKVLRNRDVVDLGGYRLTIDVGVPVAQTMSARLTTDFARRILAEQLAGQGDRDLDDELSAIQKRPDERVDLLPILAEPVSEPPPTRESRPSRPRQSRPGTDPPA
ncbi:MAG: FHA domain-containing protein, partial [Deltaproteobacteria bacterium]|nr:FHA domain-containing protein [Deltaproteobacteria bacterium]